MKRTNWSWLAPVAVVLLGAVVSAGQTPTGVEGRWDITLEKRGDVAVSVEFSKKEGQLAGTFHAVSGPVRLDSVALDGARLTFSWTSVDGVVMTYHATVKGDNMDGTWELGNADSMSFTAARRKTGGAPAGASAQSARPDFSGEWVLDLAKSVVPPDLQQGEMTVRHQDPTLAVSDRQRHGGGGGIGTYRYTTDGVMSTATQAGTTYATTGQWEGAVLVIRQKITGKMNMEPVERWSLSADGNVLTIERSRNDTKDTPTRRFVYLKLRVESSSASCDGDRQPLAGGSL